MKIRKLENNTAKNILRNMFLAAFALFMNGFGIYLTIKADIGVGPWDVLNIGLSKTFQILYGNVSVLLSILILIIDISLKEPIGIAMFIDAVVVGKAVDFFNYLDPLPDSTSLLYSVLLMIGGLIIISYTQYLYMTAALGCGPRDTLMIGLAKRFSKIPIGVVTVLLFSLVCLSGYLLGGPIGIGTLICAFGYGPIMQGVFDFLDFDATSIRHQHLADSLRVFKEDMNGRKEK